MFRQLGEEYVVVPIGAAGKELKGMIRLNKTGAYLWEELSSGSTQDDLVRKVLARYDGIDEQTASADVERFLDAVSMAIEDV